MPFSVTWQSCKSQQRRRAIQRIALRIALTKKVLWGLQRKLEQTNKTDPTALTLTPYADKDFAPLATRASPQTPGWPLIYFIRNKWRYTTSDKSKGVNMQSYKQANRQNDGFHVCIFTQFKGYPFFQVGNHRMSRYSIFLMRFCFQFIGSFVCQTY